MTAAREFANAVQMNGYGPPAVLIQGPVELPPLQPDELRIKTGLEIRAGHWPIRKREPFPYVPGVEVIGEIGEVGASVRNLSRADRVLPMMQGLGEARTARKPGRNGRALLLNE